MPAAARRRLVALDLAPGEEFVAALDAAWANGDGVLPLDPSWPAATRQAVLDAVRPDLPLDDDVALVIPTSGSTGTPKGVQLSRAALDASGRAALARLGLTGDEVWLSCLPWYHVGGLQVLLRARLSGAALRVHASFDVERFAAEREATVTSLVPTQLSRLLDAGVDLSRYKVILLGGAAASPALLARAAAAGAPVVTTYGMSETAGGCIYDGRPLDGVEIRVDVDERIWLRGPMLMSGYRLDPGEGALVDGWLRTADRGELGDDGRLVVLGRLDDVVVTGGENVDTAAVAAVLAQHPAVTEVAVTSVPDEEWGEVLVAVVVPAADGQPVPSAADLRAWAGDQLGRAALPRAVVPVDALPLLSNGKPDRLALRRLAYTAAGSARWRQSPPPSSR